MVESTDCDSTSIPPSSYKNDSKVKDNINQPSSNMEDQVLTQRLNSGVTECQSKLLKHDSCNNTEDINNKKVTIQKNPANNQIAKELTIDKKVNLKSRPSFKRDKIDTHYDDLPWIIGALGRILGLKFAPLNIPMERRLQTFAVFQWMFTFLFVILGCLVVFIVLFFTEYWWISLAYSTYLYADWGVQERGGRRVEWMRKWKIWEHMTNFFPAKIVKTAELDPKKNYIMGSHPHGILSCGAFVHFCTDGSNFKEGFPSLTPSLATLDAQFKIPFYRDYVMMTGVVGSSKKAIKYILTEKGNGNCLCVVIGGAKESLDGRPGVAKLFLKNRKGFCKVALETGSSLVPMFSFGENEVYDQVPNPPGSKVRKLQNFLQKIFGFAPCIFFGRGMFQYSFGIVPFRTPIFTVVGAPIDVDKVEKPSQSQIDELHQRYVDSLMSLYDEHRQQYAPDPSVDLMIV